jgi:hypothetical protein
VCRQVFVLTQTHATGAQRFIAYIGAFVNATMHLCAPLHAAHAHAHTQARSRSFLRTTHILRGVEGLSIPPSPRL